jgi:hypothetical protein
MVSSPLTAVRPSGAADDVVVVVTDAGLEAGRRPRVLDAPDMKIE